MKPIKASSVISYILGMAFNIAILAVVAYAVYWFAMWGFNQGGTFAAQMLEEGPDYEIIFVLEEDTPRSEAAQMLYHAGAINNPWLFQLEMFLKNSTRVFRAGTYTLNRNMSNTEVHRTFLRTGTGLAPEEEIRVLEGWTIQDMAEYFEYRNFFTAEEFVYVATYGHFNFSFLLGLPDDRPNGLEGYLFPDTYRIPINPTPGCIIVRMLRRFDYVFDADMREQAYEMGLTIDEVVIMASIIERETRLATERPMVSGVIHNRLVIDMRLEMCSTVAYVLDVPRDRLLNEDLLIDSPFNTYMHHGLPIAPISNPGAAALRAAINPASHDYLFFVLYDFESGEHFFSRTWAEHNTADLRARARQ